MEFVYLCITTFVGAGVCGAIAAVIRSLKDSELRVVRVTQLHYQMLSIAQRLEEAIGQLHLDYEWATGDWAKSGRMNAALNDARHEVETREEQLISNAKSELMELREQLPDTLLALDFERMLKQLSDSFPWMARLE